MTDPNTTRWMDVLAGRAAPKSIDEELAASARRAHLAEKEAFLSAPEDLARNVRLTNMLEARLAERRAAEAKTSGGFAAARLGGQSSGGSAGTGGARALGWSWMAGALGVGVAAALIFGTWFGRAPSGPDPLWQHKGGAASSSQSGDAAANSVQAVASASAEADARAILAALQTQGVEARLQVDTSGAWEVSATVNPQNLTAVQQIMTARGLVAPSNGVLRIRFVQL